MGNVVSSLRVSKVVVVVVVMVVVGGGGVCQMDHRQSGIINCRFQNPSLSLRILMLSFSSIIS